MCLIAFHALKEIEHEGKQRLGVKSTGSPIVHVLKDIGPVVFRPSITWLSRLPDNELVRMHTWRSHIFVFFFNWPIIIVLFGWNVDKQATTDGEEIYVMPGKWHLAWNRPHKMRYGFFMIDVRVSLRTTSQEQPLYTQWQKGIDVLFSSISVSAFLSPPPPPLPQFPTHAFPQSPTYATLGLSVSQLTSVLWALSSETPYLECYRDRRVWD